MKLDVVFLVIVVLAGMVGLYLNSQRSHDYAQHLPKRTVSQAKSGMKSSARASISSSKLRTESLSGQDVLDAKTAILASNSGQLATLEEFQSIWNEAFENWQKMLLSSASSRTVDIPVHNTSTCFISVDYNGTSLDFLLDEVAITRESNDVILSSDNNKVVWNNLLEPMSAVSNTEKLVALCNLILRRSR